MLFFVRSGIWSFLGLEKSFDYFCTPIVWTAEHAHEVREVGEKIEFWNVEMGILGSDDIDRLLIQSPFCFGSGFEG